jgi:hypothetical protein
MQFEVEKFGFRIRTRSGSLVDNLSIHGGQLAEAEAKLRRMYPGCEVIEAWNERTRLGSQPNSYEEIIDLIAPSRAV